MMAEAARSSCVNIQNSKSAKAPLVCSYLNGKHFANCSMLIVIKIYHVSMLNW